MILHSVTETPTSPRAASTSPVEIRPDPAEPGTFVLRTSTRLSAPVSEVFAYFADAFRLQDITPPWLDFRVLTPPPIVMRSGTLIDYRLRLHGWPIRWRTEIVAWDPPHRFVDMQLRGPYRLWHHEHAFVPTDEGTRVDDVVRYRVPGGRLVERLFVRRDLERIFAYRGQRLLESFGGPTDRLDGAVIGDRGALACGSSCGARATQPTEVGR